MALFSFLGLSRMFRGGSAPMDRRVEAVRTNVTEFLEMNPNPCISIENLRDGTFRLLHTTPTVISSMRIYTGGNGMKVWFEGNNVGSKSEQPIYSDCEEDCSLPTVQVAAENFCMNGPDMAVEEPLNLLKRIRTPKRFDGQGGLKM